MTEEQWMPGNKKELISAIEREWKLLLEAAEKLTDQQMTTPDSGGWSPKDNLAHLTEWLNILMGYHMDKRPVHEVIGVLEEVTKDWSVEAINPVLFERNKNRPRGEVLDGLKQAYGSLIAKLESTSFEDLLKPRHADDPEKRPLLLWVIGDTADHFLEHRETIARGIKEN
ncbi:MAG: ClbS/DfsB family four-helix bundle protein [Chloroflexi bacterium]|nr:ClbS/DfsB family four-helix bundle protein [Chloroflexota bacterium]